MSDSLEKAAELCARLASLRTKLPGGMATIPEQPGVAAVLAALDEFMECVRYLNVRRSGGRIQTLSSEADIQDALYLILRPWITDLVYENPTGKVANRFVIKDFLIPSTRTIIEAKYIRDEAHGKGVSKELHDDIENYRHHHACDDLIFFVYDPDHFIPDHRALREHIAVVRTYPSKTLRTHMVIKP